MEGTWRSDTNNFWTRADGQRWISLQLERDGDQTGFGVPEEQVAGPRRQPRQRPGSFHADS